MKSLGKNTQKNVLADMKRGRVLAVSGQATFKYSKVKYININHYIKYAKSYAKEIGLKYDATATDCWDNPIAVTGDNKKAVERDIKARLDRYKNVEGFEGICVWAKTDGGDKYLLYIGYC